MPAVMVKRAGDMSGKSGRLLKQTGVIICFGHSFLDSSFFILKPELLMVAGWKPALLLLPLYCSPLFHKCPFLFVEKSNYCIYILKHMPELRSIFGFICG
jgi:hypothetical protein